MADLATLALNQFRQRQNFLQRQRATGKITPEEATARLLPWAALALRCGADPAHVHIDLAAQLCADSSASRAEQVELLAMDLCPRPDMLAELTRARDAAICAVVAAGDSAKGRALFDAELNAPSNPEGATKLARNAEELALIASHMGCLPFVLSIEQTAAPQPQGRTAVASLDASPAGGCPRPAPEGAQKEIAA